MQKNLLAILFAASAFTVCAATITDTLPEFNGVYNPTGPYPSAPVSAGIFNYSIPVGDVIVSAMLTGTFGNSSFYDTAGVELMANGAMVASCAPMDVCDTGTTIIPFSFNFSGADLAALNSGSLELMATQTSGNNIRLGAETLTIQTQDASAVPEPGSLILLGAGLIALGLIRRKAKRVSEAPASAV